MSFSKATTEKVLDDLLLKIAELRGDEERRRSLDATTDRLMRGLRIKH